MGENLAKATVAERAGARKAATLKKHRPRDAARAARGQADERALRWPNISFGAARVTSLSCGRTAGVGRGAGRP